MSDQSLRAAAREGIRAFILGGQLRPGDRLVERLLAEKLNVSRAPVREALRELAGEGLAEERPTGGMAVRRFDTEDVDRLFEIRCFLEQLTYRHLIDQPGDAAFDLLDEVVARSTAALQQGNLPAARESNANFHATLTSLGGKIIAEVSEFVGSRMSWLLSNHHDPAAMHADHLALLAALRNRDLDLAQNLCQQHLARSRTGITHTLGF